jgi:hypothetical protein
LKSLLVTSCSEGDGDEREIRDEEQKVLRPVRRGVRLSELAGEGDRTKRITTE